MGPFQRLGSAHQAPRPAERLRGTAGPGSQRQARPGSDPHPGGSPAGRRRDRGRPRAQGLRRSSADRRLELQAAAGGHRRRDRSQRGRQDDAAADADRRRGAGLRHPEDRRDRAAGLRRSVTGAARPGQDRLGGDLRRPGRDHARRPTGRQPRLRGRVQLQGDRSADRRSASCPAGSATACTWPSCCAPAAICCCSTSRPTIWTPTRCARSKRRCWRSPAAPSSSPTIAGSWTGSRRTCWRSRATRRSAGSRATSRPTRRSATSNSVPPPTARTASPTRSSSATDDGLGSRDRWPTGLPAETMIRFVGWLAGRAAQAGLDGGRWCLMSTGHGEAQERSRRRREVIVRATIELIAEGGPKAVTHRAVSARAGTAAGVGRLLLQDGRRPDRRRATAVHPAADAPADRAVRRGGRRRRRPVRRSASESRPRSSEGATRDSLCQYEVYLEAARNPALRGRGRLDDGQLRAGGRRAPQRAWGSAPPRLAAKAFVAVADGFALHRLAAPLPVAGGPGD